MADEYEPAVTETTTDVDGAESAPIVKREPASAAAPNQEAESPLTEGGPRAQRVVSDKVRAMFKDIAAKAAASDGPGDELVPMEAAHSPPAAAVEVAAGTSASPAPTAAATAAPVATPPAAPLAPPLPVPSAPDVGKAAAEQAKLLAELREKQLAEREAKIVEREKLLPDRAALAERPGSAVIAWMRDTLGITDDGEMRTALADLVTDLSETGLGVKLPDEVKTPLEARRAARSYKAYKADMQRREQALVDARTAQEKTARDEQAKAKSADDERKAVAWVESKLSDPTIKAAHKFLHDTELTGGMAPAAVVIEVVKEQLKAGQAADWAAAARYADDYFKSQAEATTKKAAYLQSLLAPATPAPAVAPAPKAAPAPGGASGPAPRTPAPTPAPVEDDADSPLDLRDRRRQSLRKIVAKHKAATP